MIPVVDLKAQYESIREEIQAAVLGVLERQEFILGGEVAAFEREFAEFCDAAYGIAVNTGTSALHLALLAAGVGPGDEVITVPYSFIATASAIDYCGATPVFVDIDPRSYTMDVDLVEQAITPRTKAILPVHLYGQCADMDVLQALCEAHGLASIEDAAQAHGAEYYGRRAGGIGTAGCFSFYPTKNLGACGEGGMVVTNDAELADRVRLLRDWGQDRKYHHALKGYNFRLEGMQGAVLRVKLRYLEQWTAARRAHAAQYDELLAGSEVVTPEVMLYAGHVYHTYTVRSQRRDELQAELRERGIGTAVHYAIPIHLQPAFAELGYGPGDFPEAEQASREALSLPMYPELTAEQVATVSEAVLSSALQSQV